MDSTPRIHRIEIGSSTIIRTILFLLLFAFLYFIRDLVIVIIAAVVIASAIEPATRWFVRHKVPRIPAVILIYLVILTIIAFVFYFFIPTLLSDIFDLLSQAPEYIESLQIGRILESTPFFDESVNDSLTAGQLVEGLQGRILGVSSGFFSFISAIFGGVVSFVLIATISFYLAVKKDGIVGFLRIVTPYEHEEYVIDLWRRSQQKIGRWLQGRIILMIIVGILTYLGLTILGVENALFLAILSALFEIIPLFGPILSAVPAISFGLVEGGLTLGLMVAGLYLIVQQFENNLIHPLVVIKVVGVPPLVVIIALIIGGQLAGFLGVILAVPIAAVIMEYTGDIEKRKKMRHEREQASKEAAEPGLLES